VVEGVDLVFVFDDGGLYGVCFGVGPNEVLGFGCDYEVVEGDSGVWSGFGDLNLRGFRGDWGHLKILFCSSFPFALVIVGGYSATSGFSS